MDSHLDDKKKNKQNQKKTPEKMKMAGVAKVWSTLLLSDITTEVDT